MLNRTIAGRAYESPNASDFLVFDLGDRQTIGRLELVFMMIMGGVQAPKEIKVETWTELTGSFIGSEDGR